MTHSAQASLRGPFVLGLAVGGALGASWVLARRYGRDQADQLLDWDQVVAIAHRVSARGPQLNEPMRSRLQDQYQQTVRSIAQPLAAYAGTELDLAITEVRVLDRSQWVQANAANFRRLLEPVEQAWQQGVQPGQLGFPGLVALGRMALSAEMGLLLGYLARRVLGQYDITLLSPGPAEPGKLYFVEPNVHSVSTQLGLPGDQFRTWLALHEAAHAHEFEGHPWIRQHLDGLLREYLRALVDQVNEGGLSALAGLSGGLERLRQGASLLEIAMTPRQRAVFLQLQALMTLLEGYSNHVMSAVGQRLIPHYRTIEQRVEARQRQKSPAELLFLRLTGLQLKFDQYRLGAAFVARVEQERGPAYLHRVFESPETLPTLDEIKAPELWIQRMDRAAA